MRMIVMLRSELRAREALMTAPAVFLSPPYSPVHDAKRKLAKSELRSSAGYSCAASCGGAWLTLLWVWICGGRGEAEREEVIEGTMAGVRGVTTIAETGAEAG